MDEKYSYKFDEKGNSFPSLTVRMLHIDNIVPSNTFYSAFFGETLRTARSNLNFSNILPKIHELVSRILRNNDKKPLKKILNKYHGNL